MSRASTIYASAYDTTKLHEIRIRVGAKRPIRVDLNGVLPAGETVDSVQWATGGQSLVQVTSPATSDRSFSAWLTATNCGRCEIEATATASDGSVTVHRIAVWVI